MSPQGRLVLKTLCVCSCIEIQGKEGVPGRWSPLALEGTVAGVHGVGCDMSQDGIWGQVG